MIGIGSVSMDALSPLVLLACVVLQFVLLLCCQICPCFLRTHLTSTCAFRSFTRSSL